MSTVVTGSIAYDYIMSFPGKFSEHILPDSLDKISLSFHVHEMTRHWGGTGANIAFMLARLGGQPQLIGSAGKDFEDYRRWLEAAGVDTSNVRQYDDIFTASFFVNTDQDNNQIASFYAGAMDRAHESTLQGTLNGRADLVVVSPNGLEAMAAFVRESKTLGLHYMYDPSQQIVRIDSDALREGVQGAKILVTNDYEFDLLMNKTAMTKEQIVETVKLVIVTRGADGSDMTSEGDEIHIPIAPVGEIADPTGAGDAYRAGFLRGYTVGWPLELCGRMGALAATYVLEERGPQAHQFGLADYVGRFRTAFPDFDDQGVLKTLLD